jgi:hypothetical protein
MNLEVESFIIREYFEGHILKNRSVTFNNIRLLKNGQLLRFPHPSPLRRTAKYASLLRISEALHLTLFEQPGKDGLSAVRA